MSPKKRQIPEELEDDAVLADNVVAHTETKLDTPSMQSPEWNDYVLSLLADDEYSEKDGKKYPTTDGLRRVTEFLLGEINIETTLVQAPSEVNGMVAACECGITLLTEVGMLLKGVKEVADAHYKNTDFPYSKHLSAVAATRAEGRALRKLLRLRKIITAEEANSEGSVVDVSQKMNYGQVKLIDGMCSRFDIDGWKFVADLLKKKEPNKKYNLFNEVPYDFTVEVIMPEIQKFQQKDKDGNQIQPSEDIKGYDSNLLSERWRS